MEEKQRIGYLDIAKGIGILLVVWAHARAPFSTGIYLFHMPFFFLVSGYLYSGRKQLNRYFKGKICALYIPYVFWNLLSVWLKQVAGISHSDPNFLLRYSGNIILTLDKDGQFFGATWFLGTLFIISILYRGLDELLKKVDSRDILLQAISAAGMIFAFSHKLPYQMSRSVILAFFYTAGVTVKKRNGCLQKLDHAWTAIICAGLFLIMARGNSCSMGENRYTNPLFFVLGSFAASYAVLYGCRRLEQRTEKGFVLMQKTLMYLGQHSIDIVIWQFVAFRVPIALQMKLAGEPLDQLLLHYPVYDSTNGGWLLYFVAGTALPLLWCAFLRSGPWGRMLKKLSIV